MAPRYMRLPGPDGLPAHGLRPFAGGTDGPAAEPGVPRRSTAFARSALLHHGVDDALGDIDDGLAETGAAAVQLAARDALVTVVDLEKFGHARVVGTLEPSLQGDRGIGRLGRRVGVDTEGRDACID